MSIARRKNREVDLFELIMESIFVSILVSVSITSILALLELNSVQNYFVVQLAFFILFSLLIIVKINPKFKIKYDKAELLLFVFLILVFISVNINLDKFYTPDEYFYIKNSIDFIRYNYLTPIAYITSLRKFSDILVGRFLWQVTLASFIEATLGQLPYYVVNLPFFIILLSAILGLLRFSLDENNKILLLLWLIVASNPLVFIFSHFVLIDFAFASLSLFSIYWFIKSFKSESNVNIYSLVKCFIALLVSLLFKFNLIFPLSLWIVFVFSFLRNKFYRVSKWHRFLFLVVSIPIIAYELFLDIPEQFTYYVLHDLQLNSLFARYVFFTPLGMLISFLFKTPFTYRLWSDMPTSEKLFFFFSILSPDLMTPIVASSALLSFLILGKKRESKILAGTSLLSLLIAFIGSLAALESYDISRDALNVILLLQVVGLISLFFSISGRKHFVYASIVFMQFITYFEYIILADKNATFYLWGATKLENTFDRLLLTNVLLSSLVFLILLSDAKFYIRFKNLKFNFKLRTLVFVLLFLLLLTNNIDITFYGLRNNTYFLDHGMRVLACQLNNLSGEVALVISNAYTMPLYASNVNNLIFISPPLTIEEFNSFLKAGIKSKLIVSNDIIATWISYKMGSNEYLQTLPSIITVERKVSNAPKPIFDKSKSLLFHLSLINSSYMYSPLSDRLNMTVVGSSSWKDENQTKLVYLDGANDYITISGEPLLRSFQNLTIEVWFKTEIPQNGKFLVMGGYDNGTFDWGVYLSTNSTEMSFEIKGQKIYIPIVRGNFSDGFWHHFVGVFDGKSIVIYLDGKHAISMVLKEPIMINSSNGFKIYIGSWSGRRSFNGYIGIVNVYTDVFEQTDVIDQYIKAQGEVSKILAKTITVTRDYVTFDVYGRNISAHSAPDVTFADIDIEPLEVGDKTNYTRLSIDLYAKKCFSGTIILNTYYFSIFRHIEIKEGYNHIEYTFPNTIGSKLIGEAIGQKTEILILSDEGELLTKTVAASTVLKGSILLYFLLIIFLLLLCYAYVSYI